MKEIAVECRAYVLRHPAVGFGVNELAKWCARFRALSGDDREWVLIELVKMRELAVVFGPRGAPKFYSRPCAPKGAFSRGNRQSEIIARAISKT